jgi:hypothetical protein
VSIGKVLPDSTVSDDDRNNQSLVALSGAILLSAVGSLPLHLFPLIVVAVIADGTFSTVSAGWIATAILLGQLLSSLILPMLNIPSIRAIPAIGAVLLLLLGLVITAQETLWSYYLGWFLVGNSCGILLYLGTVSASNYRHTTFAFSIRLGVVLILAGLMVGILIVSDAADSYRGLLLVLILAFGFICLIGLITYRPVMPPSESAMQNENHRWEGPQLSGLGGLFVLFVGQVGFLAYVFQEAIARGMPLVDSTWSIAGMKFLAGIWLIVWASCNFSGGRHSHFLSLGILIATGIAIASYATNFVIFLVSLLIFEIAFTMLTSRFMAKVAESNRQLAGPWLTATVLLGAACGPPLNGIAIAADLGLYFLLLAVCSSFTPALWTRMYMS